MLGAASTTRKTSVERPITIAFEIVPTPGISRSGIQASITTKLTSTSAWPMSIGNHFVRPECSTSHGARPRSERTISAIEKP